MLVWSAAAATAVAMLWAPEPLDAAVQPVDRAARPATRTQAVARTNADDAAAVLELRPRAGEEPAPGLFRQHRPAAPPPPAPKPAPVVEFRGPPPPPTAPTLPFKVIGHAVDDGRVTAFLQYNEQPLVARSGDVLLEQYKVEQVSEVAVVLTFLPLNQRQTLELAAAPR